jgi:phage terminase large subunit-like protein
VKSWGPEAIKWTNASGILGRYQLLPWQAYTMTRKLELKDGRLRWTIVITTVGRQQGKSIGMRCDSWWRLHQAERFGEEQLLIHVANLSRTAKEVWRPAARHAVARYGKDAAKWGKGSEEIDLTDYGHGRWLLQAADENAGVGYSTTQANVDEAWNVGRDVVDDGLGPGMAEREQPQIGLWSTAGDATSDLLQYYREQALQDTDGSGDVLLLEWSAPPDLPWDHPNTWRWATPHWSDRREAFMRSRMAIGEAKFRMQYLNQWVASANGWIPAGVWAAAASTDPVPDRAPDVVAVEVSPVGERFAIVSAWRDHDRVVVRASSTVSETVAWQTVDQANPRVLLLPPALFIHYRGRRRAVQVGVAELGKHLGGVGRAIHDGRVRHHPADHVLGDDIGRAVAVPTETGIRLSQAKSAGPIEAARAMVWAVGEILRPSSPKPKVRAA